MPVFEKRYVHFMNDKSLEGVEGFFADDIDNLVLSVEYNVRTWYGKIQSIDYTFPYVFKYDDKTAFKFFYYDLNYEIKIAHENGKTIQVLYNSDWYDILPGHKWISYETYRIKPEPEKIKCSPKQEPEKEKPVSYRDLVMWLSRGNGEFLIEGKNTGSNCMFYNLDFANKPIPDKYLIRKWEDTEWVKPTRQYMNLDS